MNLRGPRFAGVILVLGTSCAQAPAQILHAGNDRPSFEVATIKLWKPAPAPPPPADGAPAPARVKVAPAASAGQATNRVHMILPETLLIASAYNVAVGSEGRLLRWSDGVRQSGEQYEIDAKIDDALFAAMRKMTPAQQSEQVALMEQSLLTERFHLKVHFETVEMPVYNLVLAGGGDRRGSKLSRAEAGEISKVSSANGPQGTKLTATAVTIGQFVLSPLMTGPAGRVILDQTGIPGAWDFTLEWTPEGSAPSAFPSFFTALQEQLGLKLAPAKSPTEVVIIDHIEPPSPN